MKRGFSLVELSIVLVILGLLVGGVLSGQSLIRAAELRSVSTQYAQYITAVQSFKDKYFAIPGDMANAQSFWGIAHATPSTCMVTQGTGSQTCNGNGNGQIEWDGATYNTSNESFRFWQHLANAGLIEGSYSGINGAANGYVTTTANAPKGKISSSAWWVEYWGIAGAAGDAYRFGGTYNNLIDFGAIRAGGDPINPIFKPEELWNIDTKMDDGKPAIGKVVVMAYPSGLSSCTTTVANNPATLTADYLLSSSAIACAVYFRDQF